MARLVVVSNRVSVPSRDLATRAGGLEVALRPALQHNGGVWFGWSGKVAPADQLETCSVLHKDVEYVVTDLSKHDFEEYYNGFANRVLWPILHYRLDLAEFARRGSVGPAHWARIERVGGPLVPGSRHCHNVDSL